MSFKHSTCANYIYLSSQEAMDDSDDNSRSDTGNVLETQAWQNTSLQHPRRHVPINHGMQNNWQPSNQM